MATTTARAASTRTLAVRDAAALAAVACLLGSPRDAQADGPPVDQATPDGSAREQTIDRTWLYVDDARIPAPLKVIGTFNLSYTNVGSLTRIGVYSGPSRPGLATGTSTYNAFAANTAQPGAMFTIGGELGLLPHVALMTLVNLGAGGQGPSPDAGLVAGLRVQAFPSAWQSTHLVVSAGYLREAWQGPIFDNDRGTWTPGKPYGDSGAWLQLAFAQEVGRLRVAATVHGEHVFAGGRDPLDLMVQAGATFRVVSELRLGVEYVGQDLEESFDAGAEGGPRHFMGPTASLRLLRDRLSLVAGPSFGLSSRSPEVLGRGAVAFGF